MRPAVITIRRADLVEAEACSAWLALFDAVCAERDLDRATGACVERGPIVRRRDGTTYRAADRLRIELTPLAQVWLCLPIGESGSAWAWLRAHGVVGAVSAPRADLRCANLRDANLSGADLSGADLRGANLSDANLRDANLRDADLRGADLRDADLRGANLRDADLRGANLRDANLRDADLRNADLRGADLRGADLRDANLSDADLSDADLSDADLRGADRYPDDPPVTGWTVRDGCMERAT